MGQIKMQTYVVGGVEHDARGVDEQEIDAAPLPDPARDGRRTAFHREVQLYAELCPLLSHRCGQGFRVVGHHAVEPESSLETGLGEKVPRLYWVERVSPEVRVEPKVFRETEGGQRASIT